MVGILVTALLSLIFGLGVSLCSLSILLFYTVYIKANNYNSPLLITSIAFVMMSIGSSFISFSHLML